MNLKKLIKREIIITLSSILLISAIFFGVTYAIYMRIDEQEVGTIGFGDLSFEMCNNAECSDVSNLGTTIDGQLYPMNNAEGLAQTPYTFIASNNGTRTLYITVYSTTHTDVTFDYSEISLAAKSDTDLEYTIVPMSNEITIIKEEIEILAGESAIINVLTWGSEELSNELIGQTFHTFINAAAYYYPEDGNEIYGTYIANVNPNLLRGVTFNYTGNYQEWTVPMSGYYQIETWGAQGGTYGTALGGKGGYASGKEYFEQGEKLYIYVGGNGSTGTADVIATYPGGYNGGANGYVSRATCTQSAASGGGATDVRCFYNETSNKCEENIDNLLWSNALGLNSRIIVSGGGGGGFTEYCSASDNVVALGGAGGNLYGETPVYASYVGFSSLNPTGGTQINGGQSLDGWQATTYSTTYSGRFGVGATGGESYSGGGGGYYGGASGVWQPGAGGSAYISGHAGTISVEASTDTVDTNGNMPHLSNTTKHYSTKHFTDTKMESGVREGNGLAKITYVGLEPKRINTKLNGVRYIKDCASGSINGTTQYGHVFWSEIQAIADGENVAHGILPTGPTVNDPTHPYSLITDGYTMRDSGDYVATADNTYGQEKCVTIDLGAEYDLDEVMVSHLSSNFWPTYKMINNYTQVAGADQIYEPVMVYEGAEPVEGIRITAYDKNEVKSNNLFENGYGEFGDNRNFTVFTYNSGAYYTKTSSAGSTIIAGNYIPIDTSKSYVQSITMKSSNTTATYYVGTASYDIDKNLILAYHIMYISGSLTTLSKQLNPGETVIYFDNLSGFVSATATHQLGLIFWNYQDSTGYQYPALTYSRNVYLDLYSFANVNTTNNTITLNAPWAGPAIPNGTQVSQSSSGNTYDYRMISGPTNTTNWTKYTTSTLTGVTTLSYPDFTKFRAGTKYVRFMVLDNFNDTPNTTTYYKDITFKEVP